MSTPKSDRGPGRQRAARLLALVVLGVLPLALRLWPIEHGFPRNYVPDAHIVRAALGMARDRDPVPPVGRYTTYGYLLPYVLVPLYGAQYAVGRARGEWQSGEEFAARVIEEPARAHRVARLLVAALGTLTVCVTFRGARAAGLRGGAWCAAWLAATGLMHVQFSTQERPWVPVLFFGSLAMWGAALYATRGSSRGLVAAGLASGLAFACHQAGLFFLFLCGLAWLQGPLGWRGADLRKRFALGFACVAACLAIGVLAGHPYYLRYGLVPDEEVAGFGSADADYVSIGGQALRLGFSAASVARLSRVLFGYDPVLLFLGAAGLFAALRARGTRAAAVYAIGYGAFFLSNPSDHARYLLPLTILLAWPAGLACERIARLRGGTVVLAVCAALPLVQAVRLGWVLRQQDTRADAELALWALHTGAPNTRIVIDHYGPTPELSRWALEEVGGGRPLRTREAHRLAQLTAGEERGGLDAIAAEELFWIDPASGQYSVRPEWAARGAEPRALLAALGMTHYLVSSRRPARDTEPKLAGLAAAWELELAIDPGAEVGGRTDGPRPPEAFLPTEMDFPLTGLWHVRRPGPWLGLYALD